MKIRQTRTFQKNAKRLHAKEKKLLDDVVHVIMSDPLIGDQKKAEISRVRVYKFKIHHQLMLLAYVFEPKIPLITLVALGSHENFYRDLGKQL